MQKRVRSYLRGMGLDDRGATAIEYGLIAAALAVAVMGTVRVLGTNLRGTFSTIASAV